MQQSRRLTILEIFLIAWSITAFVHTAHAPAAVLHVGTVGFQTPALTPGGVLLERLAELVAQKDLP